MILDPQWHLLDHDIFFSWFWLSWLWASHPGVLHGADEAETKNNDMNSGLQPSFHNSLGHILQLASSLAETEHKICGMHFWGIQYASLGLCLVRKGWSDSLLLQQKKTHIWNQKWGLGPSFGDPSGLPSRVTMYQHGTKVNKHCVLRSYKHGAQQQALNAKWHKDNAWNKKQSEGSCC